MERVESGMTTRFLTWIALEWMVVRLNETENIGSGFGKELSYFGAF